jgi:hypothetical protein
MIIRNGAKTISLQTLFGRLNYKPHAKNYSNSSMFTQVIGGKGCQSYFEGFKGGGGYYKIQWETWNFVH